MINIGSSGEVSNILISNPQPSSMATTEDTEFIVENLSGNIVAGSDSNMYSDIVSTYFNSTITTTLSSIRNMEDVALYLSRKTSKMHHRDLYGYLNQCIKELCKEK